MARVSKCRRLDRWLFGVAFLSDQWVPLDPTDRRAGEDALDWLSNRFCPVHVCTTRIVSNSEIVDSRPSFIVIVSCLGNSSSAASFVKLKVCIFVVRGETAVGSLGGCFGISGEESARALVLFLSRVVLVKDTSTIKTINSVKKMAIPIIILINRTSSSTIGLFSSLRTLILGKVVPLTMPPRVVAAGRT